MRKKIFRGMCAVSLLCVLLACICVTAVLYMFSYDSMRTMIRDESVYVVASLNNGDTSGLTATLATFTRITLIDADGTVVFDSKEDAARMQNHAARPEISGALQNGAAESRRYSDTLATQTYYRAIRLQNGQVVRISGEMATAWATAVRYLPYILLALVLAVIASAVSAGFLAKRIATPLNNVDLDNPLSNDIYEELSPLLRRMEEQRGKIAEQLAAIGQQNSELTAIADNMREGLVMLNRSGEIIAVNRSALGVLGLPEKECIGKHILHIHRDESWRSAVEQGLCGIAAEALLSLHGRDYQLLVSPVSENGAVQGAVILLLDITDRRQAEQMRREFTANVSHELKTPLTSISGFAELMENGMAKPADIPLFAGRIHSESLRLIALVDDILRLSRLDERSGSDSRGPVDLLELAVAVAERLEPYAAENEVTVTAAGEHAVVVGNAQVLDEMIANLVDNAVKYNRPGGSVQIAVQGGDAGACVSVADTGIGIPAEHHRRVFERFYRVDKSHSKQTGGTGLGLSIVKHGALLHGAKIELQSAQGSGTTITLRFPPGHAAG